MHSPSHDADASGHSPLRQSLVIATLGVAGMGAAFTQTILVPIQRDLPVLLDAPAAQTAWVITVTLLSATVFMPITGKLGDMYGKRLVAMGMMLFLIAGSLVAALSSGLTGMIVGRALQGLSMGVIPLGMSILRDVVAPKRLGTAIAIVSATLGVGGAIGLPLSAIVTENLNWQWLFYFCAGLGAICLTMMVLIVPASPTRERAPIDLVGAAGLAIGLVGILLAISRGNDWGWSSALTLTCLIGGLVVLAFWMIYQLRVTYPLVDLRVSARPAILLTNLASVAMGFSLFASNIAFPQLLQLPVELDGVGLDLLQSSLTLMPAGLAMLFTAPVAGQIVRRSGPRILMVVGALIIAVAYALCLVMTLNFATITAINLMIGVGIGLSYSAMPAQIMSSVPRHETAAANGLNSLMRSFGTTVAAAVIGAILASAAPETMLDTYHGVFLLAAFVSLLGALLAFLTPSRNEPATTANTAPETGSEQPAT